MGNAPLHALMIQNVKAIIVLKEYVKKKDTVSMILIVIIIRAVSIIDAKI